MEHPKATPKDFFLWAGAMIALYAGIVAFISLIFDYLNYAMPDMALGYYVDPYASIAYEMASLIVLAPLFLILMRVIRRDIARDSSRAQVWVRRWALFLTLFVAGATIAVDLIVLLTTFLNGEELSARFLLKVLVVLLVAGCGFMHFMADLWGYWARNPGYAKSVTWAVAALVVVSIVSGFFIVGTPQQARQYRLDEQRVNDLMNIQSQLVTYWQGKQKLPANLAELNDPLSYFTLPKDPATGEDYGYRTTNAPGANPSFEVCATFAAPSRDATATDIATPASVAVHKGGGMDSWAHGAGQTCFERTIDPELYPPTTLKNF
ncbi:MAG: hypothetical protein KA066_00055 [Candidatus Pacebacteria bacterium]|nr:hypothetical protein [Candidatus Paceibacterota bacterium]